MSAKAENQTRFKATVFGAISDPIRIEIINFLRQGERCVCEIIPHLNLIQPLVSRHLKILKAAGMVNCRKDSTKRMYSIVDHRILQVVDALTPELVDVMTKEAYQNVVCC